MSRKRRHAALEAYRDALRRRRARKGRRRGDSRTWSTTSSSRSPGFGFPKSHSAAFGLLAYQSAWLRHHYGAEFLAALLNAQPMGFYPPATLVRDGQRRGVETRPPDVNRSGVGCTIEDGAVRVGLKYVQGVGEDDAEAVVGERDANGPYVSVRDLAQRAPLSKDELSGARRVGRLRLASASSGASCSGSSASCRARTTVPGSGGEEKQLALPLEPTVATPDLPEPTTWERMLADYRTTSLSVGVHPLELMRPHLPPGTLSSVELRDRPNRANVAGRRDGRRAPASRDGERRRLHAARGRVRADQPDRPAAGLRPLPRASSAASRCCSRAAASSTPTATATSSSASSSRSGRSPASSPTGRTSTARCPQCCTTSATASRRGMLAHLARDDALRDPAASVDGQAPCRCGDVERRVDEARCVNACGKLPSSRCAGSYSSESSPTSLRARGAARTARAPRRAGRAARSSRRARRSTAGRRLRPAGRPSTPSSCVR